MPRSSRKRRRPHSAPDGPVMAIDESLRSGVSHRGKKTQAENRQDEATPNRASGEVSRQAVSESESESPEQATIYEHPVPTEAAPKAGASESAEGNTPRSATSRPDAVLDRLELLLSKFDTFDGRIEHLVKLTESSFDETDNASDATEDAAARGRLEEDLRQLRGELDQAWQ